MDAGGSGPLWRVLFLLWWAWAVQETWLSRPGEETRKHHVSMNVSVSASVFLPWFPWLEMGSRSYKIKWSLSSPSWFWSGFYHNNRKQFNSMIGLKSTLWYDKKKTHIVLAFRHLGLKCWLHYLTVFWLIS